MRRRTGPVHGRTWGRLRRTALAVSTAAALAVPGGLPVAAQDGGGEQPPDAVEEARREAERAQERLDGILRRRSELQAALDRAVRNFEGRRGQFGRLDEAEARLEGELDRLRSDARTTEAARDRFVRSLYKRPASVLYEWAIGQREIGDAIHRGLMVGYVLDAGARQLERAQVLEGQLVARDDEVDDLRVQAAQALVDLERSQVELNDLLVEIADLERSARQLAATTAARADELEALAARGVTGAGHCPVGVPNSFVDTWGAPRSGGRRHQGVDIFAPQGTDVHAVESGVIDRADSLRLGGITLHLDSDDGDRYYYAHLAGYAPGITEGVRVVAGQVIGYVGRTGNARTTPPHLHWEYRPGGGDVVNPTPLTRQLCR